jgi:hypothetical protein
MKPRWLKVFFLLTALEGLPAIGALFRIKSDAGSGVLFGYSAARIALAGFMLLVLLALSCLTLVSFIRSGWAQGLCHAIDARIEDQGRLRLIVTVLAYFSALGILVLVLFATPLRNLFGPIRAIVERAASLIAWGTLATSQALVLVLLAYRAKLQRELLLHPESLRYLWILVILTLVGVHWLILGLQDPVMSAFPYWWGVFHRKPFTYRDGIFVALFAAIMWVASSILRKGGGGGRELGWILLAAFATQVGFGFMEGGGFESLRQRLIHSPQNRYAINAGPNLNVTRAIRLYESRYGDDPTLATKPPGGLVFYILTEKLANLGNPFASYRDRYENLTRFASIAFPMLAVLVLVLLHRFGRSLAPSDEALVVPLLLSTVPSFVLMQLQMDQFLLPSLFMLGLILVWRAVSRGSFWVGCLAGAVVFLGVFVSFSLVPLIVMGPALAFLQAMAKRRRAETKRQIWVVFGMLVGILSVAALFRVQYGYDPLLRFESAIAFHRMVKLYEPGLGQVVLAIVQNNAEFAFWVGVPIILMAFSRSLRAAVRLVRGRSKDLDVLALGFIATFVGLNVFGQTRGEVGRLWLFMVPVLVLLACDEVKNLLGRRPMATYLLLGSELITTFLLYKFYDFF